ncbi:putative bifunctional diguanylate cyclase/phosphodiesterase [Demequina zhanjiangensis]|uniref:EAL domain-containing protein n=1 Tax=Demequina zhanjiangensis TaxID=3051659 RepID=A0ABT8G497_9MICO|nr:EAL domain-containing protein [Demequina sp. SYSU T00b26]MDN4473972.1 EAL domain-containing protein [Demequina sp. SYSU T00b26]
MSTPFVLALIAVGGGGIAILAQAAASVTDDLVNRRDLKKSLFNTAQYVLSVAVASVVYGMIAGVPVLEGHPTVGTSHILPLLVAGMVMVAVNWLLVATVVAVATGRSPLAILGADAANILTTNMVLLPIGGIAALVADDGILALALLAPPVIAAHLFAAAAARHAREAMSDSLTGLGNRAQMENVLEMAFERAPGSGAGGPALVLIDLDHFKDFNDTLGHSVGDTILRDVAQRLVAAAPPAEVHRLGGDEFAVVVEGDIRDAQRTANGLLASLDAPVVVEGLELLVRASAGVAVAPAHGDDAETLMKNADIALYHAKRERDRISTFDRKYDVNSVERLQLLADLRAALEDDQLHVVYQPQVDMRSGRTVAVEALVRWNHVGRGPIGPDHFVPLAENSGLILPLTTYVLDQALAQLAQWHADGYDLRMAVNLSARHLSDLSLPQQVSNALDAHAVPPSRLVLEVTETGILSDAVRADVVIRALRAIGVEVAIDDYGTGNASLSYLRRLEIDELKVDRSFVMNIHDDPHDLIIVNSTIELALALGVRVVAEGIEDERTVKVLAGFDSLIGQGYHFSGPVSAAQISERLISERSASGSSLRDC